MHTCTCTICTTVLHMSTESLELQCGTCTSTCTRSNIKAYFGVHYLIKLHERETVSLAVLFHILWCGSLYNHTSQEKVHISQYTCTVCVYSIIDHYAAVQLKWSVHVCHSLSLFDGLEPPLKFGTPADDELSERAGRPVDGGAGLIEVVGVLNQQDHVILYRFEIHIATFL